MPCYTVQTIKLDLENPRQEYLDEAAKALGLHVIRSEPGLWVASRGGTRYTLRNGQFNITGADVGARADQLGSEFKRAYTAAIVKAAAAKHQWNFSQAKDGKIYLQNLR